ncbi:thymidylate synthase [Acinetobacter ursingii]|uniref:Thymidylate synthase n=1 Tax=Acinetobacter ursingii TaxID=108980 RepID=A0A3D2SKI8_9GAMM|nr:thymidylate synthase [Acinetobacter ursingii]MCH2004408.1 thymidylate synthase [Acinetobacter ursingii]MCU4610558.1 thymidylate synthase [Acinetobacter ursingii]HCK29969.1 thymidylate synthase [Acinetobacter ursingii]
MHITAESLDDLLHETYEYILANGERASPTRGTNSEVRNCILTLLNPRSRISLSEVRSKVISCLGEFLWYLSGSNSIDFIEYYIKDYRDRINFTKDSTDPVPGAYGSRIFGQPNQFNKIVELLEKSKDSRRAVIAIYSENDLLGDDSRDVPCTCTLQFFIRNDKLHLTCYMRSNDAALGLVHDIFSFTLLQEIMLAKLITKYPNLELGEYTHIVGSLHIYDKNIDQIFHYLSKEGWQYHASMPPISPKLLEDSIKKILEIEIDIRVHRSCDLSKLDLLEDQIFKEMAIILFVYFFVKFDKTNISGLQELETKCSSIPIKAFINKRIQGLLTKGLK